MKVEIKETSETGRLLHISGDEADLKKIKNHTLDNLKAKVKAPGFRPGKAPISVVEKQLTSEALQREVLEEAVNHLYSETVIDKQLRPLRNPKIELKKFVPFSVLEFTAEIEIIPPVGLGDYKKFRKQAQKAEVSSKEIDQVIENLRLRTAQKNEVKRSAKKDDEVWIDFDGKDAKGKAVAGASGKDYPLRLGSDTFIPGFEKNLIGLKVGQTKSFDVKFPVSYSHKPMAGKTVAFNVKVKTVKEVILPKADDNWAKQVGPVADLKSLRDDIKSQLLSQKLEQADNKLKDDLAKELVEKSQVIVPPALVEEQAKHIRQDFINNLVYRGLTLKEYLEQAGKTEADWAKDELNPQAERRVKIGLVLSAVADAEQLSVNDEEIDQRISLYKGQQQRPDAQVHYDTEDGRRDVASRILTEKTLNKLAEYASN
ncbi:MAG TPA: trigger factor [Candidatus Saccharimonadales bacterium]